MILGIDPGKKGAFVLIDVIAGATWLTMPLKEDDRVDFQKVWDWLELIPKSTPVYLERAIPFALGVKHAFNYGKDFAAIELALYLSKLPVTYIEPAKWAKVMHAGINADLKPKAKSIIAFERLFPHLREIVPKDKKGVYHDGIVEGILIAGYGKNLMPLKIEPKACLSDF